MHAFVIRTFPVMQGLGNILFLVPFVLRVSRIPPGGDDECPSSLAIFWSAGSYALIEFKLGGKGIEEGAALLLKVERLIKKTKNLKKGLDLRESEALIILTGGEITYTRPDGVKIVPIGYLKE